MMRTLEQAIEWYISAVKSVLILNFAIMDEDADRAVKAFGLKQRIEADPDEQLSNNIEGVAEEIARNEFVGRPDELEYKGYYTEIHYDSCIRHLYGKILGISEFISFESEDIDSIEQKFHDAVDEYLEFCSEHGMTPQTPSSGNYLSSKSPEVMPCNKGFAGERNAFASPDKSGFSERITSKKDDDISDADFLRAFGIDPEEETAQSNQQMPTNEQELWQLENFGRIASADEENDQPEDMFTGMSEDEILEAELEIFKQKMSEAAGNSENRRDRVTMEDFGCRYVPDLMPEDIERIRNNDKNKSDVDFLKDMGIDPDDIIL